MSVIQLFANKQQLITAAQPLPRRKNKMGDKSFRKYSDMIANKRVWTESEIIYFRKAIGHCGIADPLQRRQLREQFWKHVESFGGILITPEHSNKGTEYLLSKSIKKNGERRAGSKLGQRELDVLRANPVHILVGLYQPTRGEYYLPIYRALDGDTGNSFEYVGTTYEQLVIVA